MTPELWQRINPVFRAALQLDPASRPQFLAEACGSDSELRDHVESLLAAESQAEETIQAPATGPSSIAGFAATIDPRFQPGQLLLNRFRILRPIGSGGMGEVYEAQDLQLGKIALKTIRSGIVNSPEIFARFRQEVLVARKVAGPQVCRIHELFLLPATATLDATAFLTMEFIDGVTLSHKLRRDGPLPWKEALPIALELCTGLSLIHDQGIVHRDLKSSNIMLSVANGKTRTVLMDFGLARDSGVAHPADSLAGTTVHALPLPETTAGVIMGTPDYMAPEQFEGRPVSPATDIYALGIVLYELVTGVHPYAATTPVAAAIHRARQPRPASSIQRALPRQWDRAIRRCLEYEPEARFHSAADLSKALRAGPANLQNLRQDRPWLMAVLVAILVALPVWAAVQWWQQRQIYRPSAQVLPLYNDGVHAIDENNYIRATRQLDAVTKQDPAFAMAHVRLAEAWDGLDFQGNAQRELLLATPAESRLSPIDRQRSEAVQAMVIGDFPHAQAIYSDLLTRLAPAELPGGYVDLGRAAERSGNTTQALAAYRKAASLDSNNPAAFMHIGILESRQQHLPEAETAFDRAQAIFTAEVNQEGLAELDFERGYAANHSEKDGPAKQFLSRALDEAEKIPSVQLQIRTLTQLSSLAYSSADDEHSVAYAQRAIRLAQDNRLDTWAADALARLANAQLSLGHLDEAQSAIDESLQQVHQSPQPRVEALADLTLASLMNQKHQPDKVIQPAQAAFVYYNRVGSPVDAFKAQMLLTRVQRDQGDLSHALESGIKLLAISAKTGSKTSAIQAEELMGSILMAQENYDAALPHFETALSLSGDGLFQPYELNRCGDTLWKLGRYDESDDRLRNVHGNEGVLLRSEEIRIDSLLSRARFQQAIALARQTLDEHPKIDEDRRWNIERNIILAEARLGEKKQATTALSTYLTARSKDNTPASSTANRLALAEIELALGQASQSRDDAAAALTYFAPLNRKDSALRAAALAAQASRAMGDTAAFRSYAAKVVDLLNDLQHTWTSQNFQKYRARPDLVMLIP